MATWHRSFGLILFVAFILLSGCGVSVVELDRDVLAELKSQAAVKAFHLPPETFKAMTPGRALAGGGGALGSLFAVGLSKSAGETMVEQYGLPDPVLHLKSKFSADFATKRAGKIELIEAQLDNHELETLQKQVATGLAFDFQTILWSLVYYPTDWSHYRVGYQARGRLVRVDDGQVVWQNICKYVGDDPNTSPTLDEMLADGGDVLKEKLIDAADRCAEQLVDHFFRLE